MIFFRNQSYSVTFLQFTAILFLIEFVRGALLISFLPGYAVHQLHLPIWVVGWAISAHYITDTVLKIGIGYLLDRFSYKVIVRLGLTVAAFSIFLLQFAYLPWLLIIAAMLYGAGISPIWIVSLSHVTEQKRGVQMALLYSVWLIALGSGPVVMNFISAKDYHLSFWVMFGMSLISLILATYFKNRELNRGKQTPLRRQALLLFSRLRRMKLLLPGMILQTAGASMLVPVLPSFAQDKLGLSNTGYTYLLMLGGICAVISMIPMGKLTDIHGRKWFLVLGFIFFALALFSITQSNTLKMSIAWAMLLGISYAAVLPAWNSLLAQYVPPSREGIGWGLLSTIEGIGVMIGPGIGGSLASGISVTFPMLVSAGLFFIIGIFYLLAPVSEKNGLSTDIKTK